MPNTRGVTSFAEASSQESSHEECIKTCFASKTCKAASYLYNTEVTNCWLYAEDVSLYVVGDMSDRVVASRTPSVGGLPDNRYEHYVLDDALCNSLSTNPSKYFFFFQLNYGINLG